MQDLHLQKKIFPKNSILLLNDFHVFLFVRLGFMAYEHLQVIQFRIHVYTNKQFYFKQFNIA